MFLTFVTSNVGVDLVQSKIPCISYVSFSEKITTANKNTTTTNIQHISLKGTRQYFELGVYFLVRLFSYFNYVVIACQTFSVKERHEEPSDFTLIDDRV